MRKKGKKVIIPEGTELMEDEKAELVMKNHTMQCFDCLGRLGYPIEKFLKQQEEES